MRDYVVTVPILTNYGPSIFGHPEGIPSGNEMYYDYGVLIPTSIPSVGVGGDGDQTSYRVSTKGNVVIHGGVQRENAHLGGPLNQVPANSSKPTAQSQGSRLSGPL